MELTAENVNKTFLKCFFQPNESTEGFIPAQGILFNFGFHPTRLEEVREDVTSMLYELPIEFFEDTKNGGEDGWSFLNMCNTKDGAQWGEHRDMEQLVALGVALGIVSYRHPKDRWQHLPGGVPYISIKLPILVN